ncbi:MAG TPA: HAMP domain-containing sensor histidine kinase, partial [Methylomirabilota bacterium]|nr:HAMP domain-containing sensor histidine kinase [Methylomirabilota bacterium]
MRLASKIFLTSVLVIVVLGGVAALSLRAINRLVSANRDIVTRTVPALRLTAAAREAIEPLTRLEVHAVVLGDSHYATAWTERAAQVADDLERLADYAQSAWEKVYLREASAAFDGYRSVVAQERALVQMGDHRRAVRLADVDARVLAERAEERLGALMSATHTRVLAVEADAARVEGRMWTSVLIALGTAVGLALIGAAFLAHRMTRSLGSLSTAAAAVASGKFREPIAITSRDEIGSLARSFNSMVAQLRRVEETRRDFFATVSHELRSPLTSIRGAAELLREGVPGPLTDKQKRLTDIVSVSSGRLLRLVNQILEMSRLQAG